MLASGFLAALLAAIPVGSAQLTVEVRGIPIEVFTYKPESYRGERMILVFHGTLRNADEYRDHSIEMAKRFRALVVAPRFDEERFPYQRYHLGGILNEDGTARPREQWTFSMVPELAQKIRAMEGRPQMPYFIIGHSAGGQFVMRMAAFVDTGAERIVAANPGTHLFPTRDFPYPYGFGNLPADLSSNDVIRRYLGQPLSIYLGTTDVIHDEYFPRGEFAFRQGDSRWERGRNNFALAARVAEEKGWNLGWSLVEARGVGHDHEKMFNHPIFERALFGGYLRSGLPGSGNNSAPWDASTWRPGRG